MDYRLKIAIGTFIGAILSFAGTGLLGMNGYILLAVIMGGFTQGFAFLTVLFVIARVGNDHPQKTPQ